MVNKRRGKDQQWWMNNVKVDEERTRVTARGEQNTLTRPHSTNPNKKLDIRPI